MTPGHQGCQTATVEEPSQDGNVGGASVDLLLFKISDPTWLEA